MLDRTPLGPQHVLAGCERISDRQLAERTWNAPLRSRKHQTQLPAPLFGDASKQTDLMDLLLGGKP
jgi:hypothetical protein